MITAAVGFLVPALSLLAQVPPPRAVEAESAEFRSARAAIRDEESSALRGLADRLSAAGQKREAEAVLGPVEPPPPEQGPWRFVPLPEMVPPRPRPRGLANVNVATSEADAIRGRAAQALQELAIRALQTRSKHYAVADECLRAVLARDPDNAEARRLLGYVPNGGGWATPFALEQLKAGLVLHPTYGWVDASWVPHLDRGELPAPGTENVKDVHWLPAADADALRNSIDRGWRITTEHFKIQTDVPLSEAIAFGRKLEAFHDLFFSLLADVIAEDLPLGRRFREKAKALPRPAPHTVYYFADQDEFVAHLEPREGAGIRKTLGLYNPPRPGSRRATAYFFRDRGGQLDVTATLFHEVSHQLLFESTTIGPNAYKNNQGNFWVFEGLGTYFETVSEEPDGTLRVGGFVGPRIEVARIRLLDQGEHVRTEQFVRLSQLRFNNPEKVYLHYAQAMALAVFLIDGHGGKYREGFLDYVRDALRGRLRESGHALDDRLGITYETLDAEFLADLKKGP